jgi:hypothetical protein
MTCSLIRNAFKPRPNIVMQRCWSGRRLCEEIKGCCKLKSLETLLFDRYYGVIADPSKFDNFNIALNGISLAGHVNMAYQDLTTNHSQPPTFHTLLGSLPKRTTNRRIKENLLVDSNEICI